MFRFQLECAKQHIYTSPFNSKINSSNSVSSATFFSPQSPFFVSTVFIDLLDSDVYCLTQVKKKKKVASVKNREPCDPEHKVLHEVCRTRRQHGHTHTSRWKGRPTFEACRLSKSSRWRCEGNILLQTSRRSWSPQSSCKSSWSIDTRAEKEDAEGLRFTSW